MVKAFIDKSEGRLYPSQFEFDNANLTNLTSRSNSDYMSDDPDVAKTMIGMTLAFYTGLIQIVFAVLHVGFVTKYLSDVIVAAFTTGAAYHIVVSQLNTLLGIQIHAPDTPFKITAVI